MDESKQELTDVGTRYEHLTDLLNFWETGLDVMERIKCDSDKERRPKLEGAVELLKKYLDNKSGYDYRAWSLRSAVDSISKDPSAIDGGRGTPLRKEQTGGKKGKQ